MKPGRGDYRDNGCQAKHDHICDNVARVFQARGWRTETQVDYQDPHFKGDFDVYAAKPGYAAITEVKSNHYEGAFLDACNQLAKAKTHAEIYKPQERIFTFYAATDQRDNDLRMLWIPRKQMPNKYERQLPEDLREICRGV